MSFHESRGIISYQKVMRLGCLKSLGVFAQQAQGTNCPNQHPAPRKNALEETQIKQQSIAQKFENILIHEFKSSVSRIESGLQLLHNQYISAEQKDAVEIISLGKDDLNAKLDQIIQINRIDKGQTGVGAYQFSPTALITQIVNDYQPLLPRKILP